MKTSTASVSFGLDITSKYFCLSFAHRHTGKPLDLLK